MTLYTSDVPVAKLQKSTPLPNEPQASFPKMVVGDSWVVTAYGGKKYGTDTYSGEVISVDQNGSFDLKMKRKKSCGTWTQYYDINEPYVHAIIKTTAGGGILSFPLFVGKTWTAKGKAKSMSGKYNEYKMKFEVKTFERVNTKAGQFEAFRIKRDLKNINTNWSGWSYFWYSPKVKAIIKSKHKSKRGANLISVCPKRLCLAAGLAIKTIFLSLPAGHGAFSRFSQNLDKPVRLFFLNLCGIPAFRRFAKLTGTNYRVFFSNEKELDDWLDARSYKRITPDEWDEGSVAEWIHKKTKRYIALKEDIFDDAGRLKPYPDEDCDDEWLKKAPFFDED